MDEIPAENKRTAKQGKLLEAMSFDQIIGMTNVKKRKPIEFQERDPYALDRDRLV